MPLTASSNLENTHQVNRLRVLTFYLSNRNVRKKCAAEAKLRVYESVRGDFLYELFAA